MKQMNWMSHCMLVGFASIAVVGCGGASDAPTKFTISGMVTYDKQPIVKGRITFSPDDSAGNKGPGGIAYIVNGKYQTETGKGVVGGPHVVQIVGFDGVPVSVEGEQLPDGKALFVPYFTTVNFPKQDTTQDFDVPNPESK